MSSKKIALIGDILKDETHFPMTENVKQELQEMVLPLMLFASKLPQIDFKSYKGKGSSKHSAQRNGQSANKYHASFTKKRAAKAARKKQR